MKQRKEATISNLSHGFLENALWHLSKTTRTYKDNCGFQRNAYGHRSLIAPRENRHATSTILNLYTAIEFILTTESFRQGLQEFSSDDNAIKKARKLNVYSEKLLQALTEVSIPRDTISHAYLWETQRTLDEDYNIVEVNNAMWEKYLSKLRPKYSDNVNLDAGVTTNFGFNIVPDKIDFLDGVKSLSIANKIYLGTLKDSNSTWRPQFYPHKQEGFPADVQTALSKKYDMEDWLNFFKNQLCSKDEKELESFIKELG